MSIVLFKEITTEDVLLELEAEGKKYEGLYVDMEDKKQRKYVKDSAALVNGLLKKVERARIDKSKEYKANVEAEAKEITARLEAANAPFSLLIEAHSESRKQILAEEKRVEEVKEAARLAVIAQALRDEHHEMATLLMAEDFRQREAAAEQARLDQIAHDDAIALKAKENAELSAKAEIEQAEADKQAAIIAAKVAEERAAQDAIDAKEREKQAVIAADNLAEQARVNAEIATKQAAEKAEADKQAAIKEEKRRAEQVIELERLDAAKREANTKHKGKINREAMEALMKCGADVKVAKKIVGAIFNNLIPNVKISY